MGGRLIGALERALGGWRHGRLTVDLPGGRSVCAGDPDAADRARIAVHHPAFLLRLALRGELGAGESYAAGEWSADDLVGALRLFLRNLPLLDIESRLTRLGTLPDRIRHRLLRANTRTGSRRNVAAHYDLGNAFYRLFLDDGMTYSCAIYDRPEATLAEAQAAKLERVCAALALRPGDHLLEVGCGWGSLAVHAARTRGCRVTGITLSREQLAWGRARVAAAGLADRVELRLLDYRDLHGHFDAVASVEMVEAVGERFLSGFFAACAARLRPGGRLLVQSILMPDDRFAAYRRGVDWMQTYVFPGTCIPSLAALIDAAGRTGLTLAERHEIGLHYATTLRAWRGAFRARRAEAARLGIGPRRQRTWELYLAFSEAAFAEQTLLDSQLLFAR
ncbi:MAG TPA: cyclopropane-fatty-acyl-phospholipid synthase family protein [Kofleriaceae bacterium]|nr:cyclopropane-fatty-acyl-phospholipid synthase family protein [Kofleriaceae bacterium]